MIFFIRAKTMKFCFLLLLFIQFGCKETPERRVATPYRAEGSSQYPISGSIDENYIPASRGGMAMGLQVMEEKLSFDANYTAKYKFTLRNNLTTPVVAFTIIYDAENGYRKEKRYKNRIMPNELYFNSIEISSSNGDIPSGYLGVSSYILEDGKMYDLSND